MVSRVGHTSITSQSFFPIQSNTFDRQALTSTLALRLILMSSCMSLGYKSLLNFRLNQKVFNLYIKPFISIIDIMEIFKTIVFLLLCGTIEAKKRSFCNAQTCNKCAKIYVFGRSSNSKLALVSSF